MKIELEKIRTAMEENNIEEPIIDAVITQLKSEVAEEELADETPEVPDGNEDLTDNSENLPKVKYEYVIILNDKEGFLKDKEIAGWVVQQEENTDAGLIVPKLIECAKDQNSGKKKKNQIVDLTSLFEYLKPKATKSQNLKIKTKDLTRVIVSNGKFI